MAAPSDVFDLARCRHIAALRPDSTGANRLFVNFPWLVNGCSYYCEKSDHSLPVFTVTDQEGSGHGG